MAQYNSKNQSSRVARRWFTDIDTNNIATTITANGTFGFALSGCPVKFVRLRLVSFSGGTPSVIGTLGAM